ncbi:glycoside hydrolase family 88 protein [Ferviditalea candida]|uniref:Glycoside hydrolase family 88 protein n=1 Tax=Ferviditalea candida TaxID=3108399 RepID=A0ABU5ZE58_9BACL|nr:glycoside hydrolase family 88 protein [Paenibacillaceae bacterium T2]
MNHTPRMKVTDHTRWVVIDMLRGNYSKRAIQHWQEASLLLGLSEYLKQHDDQAVKREVWSFLDSRFDSSGDWIEKPEYVDGAILAYAVMKLEFIDLEHYRAAFELTWRMIEAHIGEDSTIMYRTFMKDYRYVDTIGFVCPFLVSYGIKYNKPECIDLAYRQIKQYELHGMLEDRHIPCHAYQIGDLMPLGIYGWGRGLGWYALGLIDSWLELPAGHKYKASLEESIKGFATAVISLQQANGGWNWTVTRRECRSDSSATAALGWFLLNASRVPGLTQICLNHADKAIHYLAGVTRRNGAVDFSQGDTKDIGAYSTLFNIMPFTQGLCVRMMHSNIVRSRIHS